MRRTPRCSACCRLSPCRAKSVARLEHLLGLARMPPPSELCKLAGCKRAEFLHMRRPGGKRAGVGCEFALVRFCVSFVRENALW